MTVFANGFSITHKGDNKVNVAAPPDVCKTPSPGGPIPIPYVNIARTGDLADGSKKTKIEGNPAALKSSNLSTSSGDEPGSAGGGLISSKQKGKAAWVTSSLDVKIEGKGVVRFLDVVQHNGNTYNTAFIQQGGTGLAYGDDFEGNCKICDKEPEKHRILETPDSVEECRELIKALKAADRQAVEDGENANRTAKPDYGETGIVGYKGYMVGVMICKCGEKFAAMSGRSTTDGFKGVVDDGPWTVVEGGQVSKQELIGASRRGQPNFEGLEGADRGAEARRAGQVKRQIGAELAEINKTEPNPKVGICAAAKLIGRSPAKDHVPAAMTEMYFGPDETDWKASYPVLTKDPDRESPKKDQLSNVGATPEDYDYGQAEDEPTADDSVASCTTCQAVLPLSLCDTDENSC